MTSTIFTVSVCFAIFLALIAAIIFESISSRKRVRLERIERLSRTVSYTGALIKSASALPYSPSILEAIYRRLVITLEFLSIEEPSHHLVLSKMENARAKVAEYNGEPETLGVKTQLVLPRKREDLETFKRSAYVILLFLKGEEKANMLPSNTISSALGSIDLLNCLIGVDSHYKTAKASFEAGRFGTAKLHLDKAISNLEMFKGDPTALFPTWNKVESLLRETTSVLERSSSERLVIEKAEPRVDGLDRMGGLEKQRW